MAITFNHNDQVYVKDGNLAIGTASPATKLNLKESNTGTEGFIITNWNNVNTLFLGSDSTTGGGKITLRTNGGDSNVFISSYGDSYLNGGNVGIGTASPGSILHIKGGSAGGADFGAELRVWENDFGAQIQGSTNGNTYAFFGNFRYNFNTPTSSVTNYLNAGHGLLFKDGVHIFSSQPGGTSGDTFTPSERLTILNDGNVGIGTTNPNRNLHVIGQFAIDNSAGTPTAGMLISADSASNKIYSRIANNNSTALPFEIISGSSSSLYISTDGNVGIGTTNPNVKLQVEEGVIRAIGTTAATGQIDSSPNFGAFRFYDGSIFRGGLGMGQWAGVGNDTDIVQYLNNVNYYISNGTTPLVKVETGGNVGIGTTNPSEKLEVLGDIKFGGSTNGDWAVLEHATKLVQFTQSNAGSAGHVMKFRTPGWSADAFIFTNGDTETMRITGTGNVGIGTTSPGKPLHVVGGDSGSGTHIAHFEGRFGVVGMYIRGNGNVGIGTTTPDAPLHIAPAAGNYKVIKLGDDTVSHYRLSGQADHTLTLTCGSYYMAEVVITAAQSNSGGYNNLYIRGIWSNNHTSHHWDVLEEVGYMTNNSISITNTENDVSNSGKLEIFHDHVQSFLGMTVRVTDYNGTHSYTIS